MAENTLRIRRTRTGRPVRHPHHHRRADRHLRRHPGDHRAVHQRQPDRQERRAEHQPRRRDLHDRRRLRSSSSGPGCARSWCHRRPWRTKGPTVPRTERRPGGAAGAVAAERRSLPRGAGSSLVLVAVLAVARGGRRWSCWWSSGSRGDASVDQARPGPVIVLPGYGGDTSDARPARRRAAQRRVATWSCSSRPSDEQGDLRVQAERLGRPGQADGGASPDAELRRRDRLLRRRRDRPAVRARRRRRRPSYAGCSRWARRTTAPTWPALAEELAGGCPTACEQLATGQRPAAPAQRRATRHRPGRRGPTVRTDVDQTVTPDRLRRARRCAQRPRSRTCAPTRPPRTASCRATRSSWPPWQSCWARSSRRRPTDVTLLMSLVAKFAQAAPANTTQVGELSEHAVDHVAPPDRVAEQVDEREPVAGQQVGPQRRRPRRGRAARSRRPGSRSCPARRRPPSRSSCDRNSAMPATPSIASTTYAEGQHGALEHLRLGQRRAGDARPRRSAGASPSSSRPSTYATQRHHEHRQHHERDDADQLGHQQPHPRDRSHEQVAQGAGLRLARDRVAADDRDRDRQEQRQHDPERGEREQRPVGEHRGEERRAGARDAGRGRSPPAGPRPGWAARSAPRWSPRSAGGAACSGQLDPDHRTPSRRLGRGQHDLLEAAAAPASSSRTRTPAATSSRFRSAGSSVRTTQLAGVAVLDPAVEQRDGPRRRRESGRGPARSRRAARSCPPGAPAVRGRARRPGCDICSISASRWLERKIVVPLAVELEQQLPDVPDALRVEPVGGLVEHEQRRPAHQRGSRARVAAACPGSRSSPAARRAGSSPTCSSTSSIRARRRPRPRWPPGRRRRTARGWRGRTGAGRRPVPRPGRRPAGAPRRRCGHRLAEQLGLARGRQHQAEQHPDGRGLARAVGAEEAVDVALAHVEVDGRRPPHGAVGLGQPVGPDHRSSTRTIPRSEVAAPPAPASPGVTVPVSRSPRGPVAGPAAAPRAARPRARRCARSSTRVAAAGELLVEPLGDRVAQRDARRSAVGPRP